LPRRPPVARPYSAHDRGETVVLGSFSHYVVHSAVSVVVVPLERERTAS
jgi:hypothetical protein